MRGGKSLVTNSVRNARSLAAVPGRSPSRLHELDTPRRRGGAVPHSTTGGRERPSGATGGAAPAGRAAPRSAQPGLPAAGGTTVTVVPAPEAPASAMLPPLRSTSSRQIHSPRPIPGTPPFVAAAPRKPNSNTCLLYTSPSPRDGLLS